MEATHNWGAGHTGGCYDGAGGDGWLARPGCGSAVHEERIHCFPTSAVGKVGVASTSYSTSSC